MGGARAGSDSRGQDRLTQLYQRPGLPDCPGEGGSLCLNSCRVGSSAFQDQDLGLMDRPELLGDFYKDTLLTHLFSCGSVRQEARVNTASGVLEFQLFPAAPTLGRPSSTAFADSQTCGLTQVVVPRGNAILSSSSGPTRRSLQAAGVTERLPGGLCVPTSWLPCWADLVGTVAVATKQSMSRHLLCPCQSPCRSSLSPLSIHPLPPHSPRLLSLLLPRGGSTAPVISYPPATPTWKFPVRVSPGALGGKRHLDLSTCTSACPTWDVSSPSKASHSSLPGVLGPPLPKQL